MTNSNNSSKSSKNESPNGREELREQKKLKGRPKIRASQLNDKQAKPEREGKRPGSAKKSKKAGFEVDEEKIIQPEEIPANAKFNGQVTWN